MKVLLDKDVKKLIEILRDCSTCVGIVKRGETSKDWNLYSYCSHLELDIKRMLKKLEK